MPFTTPEDRWRFAEVHHRVANSFQLAASLLHSETKRTPETFDTLEAAASQLMAFSALHRHLMAETDDKTTDTGAYIASVCAHLETACLAPRGISITLDHTPCDAAFRQCLLLGIVATELIINAAKHGFQATGGTIRVQLEPFGSGALLLVSDDGRGIIAADDFFDASTVLGRLAGTGRIEFDLVSSCEGTCIMAWLPKLT